MSDEDFDNEVRDGNQVVGARSLAVVEYIARALADEPDAVNVEADQRADDEVFFLIHASSGDMGRLIGRRGRIIQAIRQITRAAGAAEGVKVGVDVAD